MALNNNNGAPVERVLIPTPQGVTTPLHDHQREGLAWLLERESQEPGSGILGDDMGLGKTLMMISLIVEQKNRRLANQNNQELDQGDQLASSTTTLVVAPASVSHQWKSEIELHVVRGTLTCTIYHGQIANITPENLATNDVVITTYGTLRSRNSVLHRIEFERIILDEAHYIKNKDSKVSERACELSAVHRWALTGTPIQNSLSDLYSLIRFTRIDQEDYGRRNVVNAENHERLHTMLREVFLRRTKDQVANLPRREYQEIHLYMQGVERAIYERMSQKITGRAKTFKLPQACVHPSLIENGVNTQDYQDLFALEELAHDFAAMGLEAGPERNVNDLFSQKFKTAKISAILTYLLQIMNESNDKVVIVSQWRKFLNFLRKKLDSMNMRNVTISGESKPLDRHGVMTEFNSSSSRARIMLLSLKAGGTGLNLIGANHLFLTDPNWNPTLEQQAVDRIYRIGQTKDVFIYKLIVKNTIEDVVVERQDRKKELARSVLDAVERRNPPPVNGQQDPEEGPEDHPEEQPEDRQEEDPEEDSEDSQEEDSEDSQEEDPEEGPEEQPEDRQEEGPEEDPEDSQEEDPEEGPEDEPEDRPGPSGSSANRPA